MTAAHRRPLDVPCILCRDPAAVYPLACAALAPDGRRIDRGAPVCVACVRVLEDAPETPAALALTAAGLAEPLRRTYTADTFDLNTNGLRRERTTVRRREAFVPGYVEVSAIRCTVCGGTWPDDRDAAHRPGCLDAEVNGGNS